jgi:osmotically-inducible protein OsmY
MIRRLLALIVLVVLVGAALYYWKGKPRSLEGSIEETKDTLGDVGASIGDKIQATKASASVKAALELHRELSPFNIDVDGRDEGVVALQGDVPSEELKNEAQQVAQAVPDVRRVVNELRVNPALGPPAGGGRTLGESLDDRALEGKVNLAFSLNRQLQGSDIDVHAYRRQVTLRGSVQSADQRRLAVDVARRTPDVLGVTDEMSGPGQPVAAPGGPAPGLTPAAPSAAPSPAGRQGAARLPGEVERDYPSRVTVTANPETNPENRYTTLLHFQL